MLTTNNTRRAAAGPGFLTRRFTPKISIPINVAQQNYDILYAGCKDMLKRLNATRYTLPQNGSNVNSLFCAFLEDVKSSDQYIPENEHSWEKEGLDLIRNAIAEHIGLCKDENGNLRIMYTAVFDVCGLETKNGGGIFPLYFLIKYRKEYKNARPDFKKFYHAALNTLFKAYGISSILDTGTADYYNDMIEEGETDISRNSVFCKTSKKHKWLENFSQTSGILSKEELLGFEPKGKFEKSFCSLVRRNIDCFFPTVRFTDYALESSPLKSIQDIRRLNDGFLNLDEVCIYCQTADYDLDFYTDDLNNSASSGTAAPMFAISIPIEKGVRCEKKVLGILNKIIDNLTGILEIEQFLANSA